MQYFYRDTKLPQYIPLPRFLLPMDIGLTAKILYGLILSRTTLSARSENVEKWSDEAGRVYVFYTLEHMSEDLNRSVSTIKDSLRELEKAFLIERIRQGLGRPNRIYIIFPSNVLLVAEGQEPVPQMAEYRLPGRRYTGSYEDGIPAPNNMNRTKEYSDMIIY